MSGSSSLLIKTLPMYANKENDVNSSNAPRRDKFGSRKSFALGDLQAQTVRKSLNNRENRSFTLNRSFTSTRSADISLCSSKSTNSNGSSRWQNLNISELHSNPCKVLKSLRAEPKTKKSKSAEKSARSESNLAIRRVLRRAVKQCKDINQDHGARLIELFNKHETSSTADRSLFSLCQSFNSFMEQREDTLHLLQIPLYESKPFDHKSVHNSFKLFNMLAEMMSKEIRLSEIDLFIRTSRGCDGFFGHQKAIEFSKAITSLRKVVFQSPCKKTVEVAQLMALVKTMVDDFTCRLWTFNVLSAI